MKAFMYDQHYGYLLAEIEVVDANNLPPYTTTVVPDPTKSYQKFNGTEWVGGMDNATFQQQVEATIQNTLGLQVASLTAENKQLKQSINQLGLQLAQLTMKDKKENGGN